MTKARNLSLLSAVEAGATTDQTKSDIDGLGIAASSITGALPAISAANLTSIPAANVTGVLPVGTTGGSGLTTHGRIGASARSYLTSNANNQTGSVYITGMTSQWIRNTDVFEAAANGIKVKIAGTYLCTWGIYTYSTGTSSSGTYHQEYLTINGATISDTHTIYCRSLDGHADRYELKGHAHTITLSANDIIGLQVHFNSATGTISSGVGGTHLALTYISEN